MPRIEAAPRPAAPGWLATAADFLHPRRGDAFRGGRYLAILAIDALACALALVGATWLRFEGRVPAHYLLALPVALPLLLGCRLFANMAALVHRWSFRLAGLADAVRVVLAGLGGSLVFLALLPLLVPHGLPRSVYALEFFFSMALFGALRFGPRLAMRWLTHRIQARPEAAPTVIVGSGEAAALLARDLQRDPGSLYRLVGFVTGDETTLGWRIEGQPVLGTPDDLPALARSLGVRAVLLADPGTPARSIRELLDTCAHCRMRFKIVPGSPSRASRPSAALLDDLSPEDLLPRDSVAFDEAEMSALVRGRRTLVTGAGGSIGSELCRQLAAHGVGQLVMVDMNENELYLGALRLAERHPEVEIHAEVADVREQAPLLRLGRRYRPQDVFHAAAHKHVPLMEDAPAEAVKNNVFGTLHAARMAHLCGVERFVLISTDKAVKPSSVMGVTKRVAEQVVRRLARTSATRMTAVRFGNVLGSAGSVLPIFRQQIARGGPVTVTHEECTRYFMTIPEAVGLVLLAGLGGHGELCVLDMGEPIRIADLARNLITLAGLVPGDDVPIVYTGLRPGEKLREELLTEEEERSEMVRDRIHATRGADPPVDLEERLQELWRLADAGDRDGLRAVLHALVPSYEPSPPRVAAPRPPAPVEAQVWAEVGGAAAVPLPALH
jgi:FlaA1/EpsC-like NDP-sugar epimerase